MATRTERPIPGPGQESVWDYPRPPRVEPTSRRVRVEFNGLTIVDTVRAMRVLETSHPPAFYLPPDDIQMAYLTPTARHTFCEFKGAASYWTLRVGNREVENVAWSYQTPSAGFEVIRGYLAFYPGRVDACFVDNERVLPQEGDFYGGWITSEVLGPFKGPPGTWGW
ncbi:MAG: DUF427 domain-containing protein [Anaerolineae bacterium]|nr:DUF427 domain-containing protein [Anaerolineae bacterium]